MRFGRALAVIAFLVWPTFGAAAPAVSLPDFSGLVERKGASVVNISSTMAPRASRSQFPGLDENAPMFDFFRKFIPRHPEIPRGDPDNRSLGSGFIISADGYILTNAHVVDRADEILVKLVDKREYRASVVGADLRSDVALLKIDANGLPQLDMGDPSRLKVGEWVVAIGSPFGFDHSVTAGIVSAKGRSLPNENFVPFIQTDVAINPGNSGGPLFNLKGEVVGINSQIYSETGGFMGLSFAIPIDLAMDVQQQLRAAGRVQRGRIGVAIQEVTLGLAESFALPSPDGALVSAVEAGGPAARAGLERGDVIRRFGGKPIESSGDLPRVVATARPGSQAVVQVYRNGAPREFTVTLGEWTDEDAPRARRDVPSAAPALRLGLAVAPATPAQLRERNVEHGLVVERVEGPAARAELQAGDIVVAVVAGGRQVPMRTVDEFGRRIDELKDGQTVTLLLARDIGTSYVTLRAGG